MNAENLNWDDVTGGQTHQRFVLAQAKLTELQSQDEAKARLEECQDEKTGRRFGQANIRKGKAIKIGGGGRNRGSGYAYQVWLVWN